MMRLLEKVAIVTGGGRGIGRGISLRFAQEGAMVVLAEVDTASATRTAEDIKGAGGLALAFPTDVSRADEVEALVEAVVAEFSRIDILVNNAAMTWRFGVEETPFLDISLESWQRMIDVNLTGAFLCSQSVARVMVQQGGGKIINIGSVNSFMCVKHLAHYVASKGGVSALTRSMAVDLAAYGISVNAIAPGPILAGGNEPTTISRVPLQRAGSVGEVAAVAVFLSSDESSYVNGHILVVDGGMMAAL